MRWYGGMRFLYTPRGNSSLKTLRRVVENEKISRKKYAVE